MFTPAVRLMLAAMIAGTAAVSVPLPDTGTDAGLPIPARHLRDGHAARWDSCHLTVSVDLAGSPAGAGADTATALDLVGAATGVTFTRTTGNADVTISWGTLPGHEAGEHVTTAGEASVGYSWRGRRGLIGPRHRITDAVVVLSPDTVASGGASGQLGYLVHELGHAVGLDHADRTDSVMRPIFGSDPFTTLTDLDRDAFAAIAPPGCLDA